MISLRLGSKAYLFLFTLLIMIVHLKCTADYAAVYENEYNHFSGKKIQRLKICGERCSGTNFLMLLMHANFPDLGKTELLEYGQKHFMWWQGTNDYSKLAPLKYERNAVDMEGSSDCLFVVVIRDPYDWLRSFFDNPYSVHNDLLNKGFSHFLRAEWKLFDIYVHPDGNYDEIDNINPWTNQPFSNVLELRKYKIQNYLELSKIVDNYIFVRYEDVRDDPKSFIEFVKQKFHLRRSNVFNPISTYKLSHLPYYPKKYFQFSEDDLKFINSYIDWEIEGKVGYTIKYEVN